MYALHANTQQAPTSEPRKLMVSAFYPVAMRSDCEEKLVKYMPEQTAAILETGLTQIDLPEGTLGALRLTMCSLKEPDAYYNDHPGFKVKKYPLVIFSPGGHLSRLWHGAQAQKIASNGYTVITIDHPYDAWVVEYPDGKLVMGTEDIDLEVDPEGYIKLLQTRAKDVSFVLDELTYSKKTLKQLLPLVNPDTGIDTSNVPMYGHSAGGAAAATVMAEDERIGGGLNLDGDMAGPVLKTGVTNPYMMVNSDHKPFSSGPHPTFSKIWPHLFWGLELKLKKSHHGTFMDTPYLAHLLGFEPLPKKATEVLGSIPGDRAMEIITSYVVSFLKFIVKGKEQVMLQQESADFPEMDFIRQVYSVN